MSSMLWTLSLIKTESTWSRLIPDFFDILSRPNVRLCLNRQLFQVTLICYFLYFGLLLCTINMQIQPYFTNKTRFKA